MEKLFIEAKSNIAISLSSDLISLLPPKIALATTVQFIHSLPSIKKQLKDKKVTLVKGIHSLYPGQVLGCDALGVSKKLNADCILYIGTGRFHPLALAYKYNIETITYDPFTAQKEVITAAEIDQFQKRKIAAITRFFSSEIIGIIKTTKKGQSASKKIIEQLKKDYNKEYYEFISDEVDFLQLNNFNFIDCWVNTACPRIAYDDYSRLDKPIVNIGDLGVKK
jgi:2-(3-amino-3-carboxypropyl)histidine synthase